MIEQQLFGLQDEAFRAFMLALIPTVDPQTVIGVRTPQLRALAKRLPPDEAQCFCQTLPHTYFEENNLHGFLIEQIRDFDACLNAMETFLPYIDNWATCDQIRPKALAKQPQRLLQKIDVWLTDPHPYTARYAVGLLMRFFLDDRFAPEHLHRAASALSGPAGNEYYVKMMVAWYFATALAKQYDAALPLLDRLDAWTRAKAIQKALESRRVPADRKAYLRSIR